MWDLCRKDTLWTEVIRVAGIIKDVCEGSVEKHVREVSERTVDGVTAANLPRGRHMRSIS
jgi:hypothetical protein